MTTEAIDAPAATGRHVAKHAAPTDNTEPAPDNDTKPSKMVLGIGAVVIAGVIVMTVIGFAASFQTVKGLAVTEGGFSPEFAKWVPISIDSGIVVFLGLDLLMAFLGYRFPLVRYTAWALTVTTIYANGSAATKPLGIVLHVVMPLMFVGGVEAGRHYIARKAKLAKGIEIENPPLIRLVPGVAFRSTVKIWAYMRKHNHPKYSIALSHFQDRDIFRSRMVGLHGKDWQNKQGTDPEMQRDLAEQKLILKLSIDGGRSIEEARRFLRELEEDKREQAEAAKERKRLEDQHFQRLQEQEDDRRDERARQKRLREEEDRRNKEIADQRAEVERAELAAKKEEIDLTVQAKAGDMQVEQTRKQQRVQQDQERFRADLTAEQRQREWEQKQEQNRLAEQERQQQLNRVAEQQRQRQQQQRQRQWQQPPAPSPAPAPQPETQPQHSAPAQPPVPPPAPAPQQHDAPPSNPVPPQPSSSSGGRMTREQQQQHREKAIKDASLVIVNLAQGEPYPDGPENFGKQYGKSKRWAEGVISDARRRLSNDREFADKMLEEAMAKAAN